jgi:hypothetical protein
LKRFFLAAAVLATVAAIFLWSQLPPKRESTAATTFSDGTVAGILHVHSSRSDGRGTPEQIAHDAARAGLKFVVITDHGDGTRPPEPAVYREGVLCIEGTEISTRDGHYIAVDMPASPYPLGGDGRDVVEDVKRLGGFGIVAHPDSPKPELAWRAWNAPFDAVEILNLDTMWRRRLAEPGWRSKAALQTRLLTYAVRPVESIASLVLRSAALQQWSAVASRRHVVMLAGADAHAQIAWRASDPISATLAVPIPSYVSLFRTLSIHVRPERALSGDAKADAAIVLRAIRAGHLYTAVDGLATPPEFEMTATNSLGTVRMGDQLYVSGPVTLHVRTNAPDGFTTTIWNGTTAVTAGRSERDFTVTLPEGSGVYWAEVRPGGKRADVPWITSNPIYVRASDPQPSALPRPAPSLSTPLFAGQTTTTANWNIYHDATSLGAVDASPSASGDNALRLRFGLANGPLASQFVALGVETPGGVASYDRLSFIARAQQTMRISVQLQTEQSRWERSVYVDFFNQPHTIFFDEFRQLDGPATPALTLADVKRILFVVDTTNAKPGTSGRLWIAAPTLQR